MRRSRPPAPTRVPPRAWQARTTAGVRAAVAPAADRTARSRPAPVPTAPASTAARRAARRRAAALRWCSRGRYLPDGVPREPREFDARDTAAAAVVDPAALRSGERLLVQLRFRRV